VPDGVSQNIGGAPPSDCVSRGPTQTVMHEVVKHLAATCPTLTVRTLDYAIWGLSGHLPEGRDRWKGQVMLEKKVFDVISDHLRSKTIEISSFVTTEYSFEE